jgi:hypothetical protein
LYDATEVFSRARELKFWFPESFKPLFDVPYFQNLSESGIFPYKKNGEMKVLFSEFDRRTCLLALLFKSWSPVTKLHTQNFEN